MPAELVDQPIEPEIFDKYSTEYPTHQNAIELFEGHWSSIFPDGAGVETGGFAALFEDPRIDWMVEAVGGVAGRRILDLGPLEGGHAHRLETMYDAAEVVAIEANERAYLRCLVAKEILGTSRTRFLLGDFNRYLATSGERFDLVVASGVLYHMENPAEHIKLCCGAADEIYVWTHYYDADLVAAIGPDLARKFNRTTTVDFEGYVHDLHQQDYLDALGWGGFCGAGNEWSNWLRLDDIHGLFDKFGFDIVETAFHNTVHDHGPALAFVARRRA